MSTYSDWFKSIKHFIKTKKWQSALIGMSLGYITNRICGVIYKKYKCYPPGPYGIPIFGSFFQFIYYPEHLFRHVAMTYGPIASLTFFGETMIFLNDSAVVKQLLCRREYLSRKECSFHDKNNSMWCVRNGATNGVLPFILTNNDTWTRRRKHTQTALFKLMTAKKVENIMQTAINNELNPKLLNIINDNSNSDVWYPRKLCSYLAFNTIYHCCFAKTIPFNGKLYTELSYLIDELFRNAFQAELFSNLPILRLLNLPQMKKYDYIRERRNEIIKNLIDERKEILNQNPNKSDNECFIDCSLKAKEKGNLTDIEIVADTYFLFAAGSDTTSGTLENGIVLCAKYKNITSIIRNELFKYHNAANTDSNGFLLFNLKKLNKYVLFRAFIYEILRISSVVPIGVNHANNDKDFSATFNNKKYFIPKNCEICYSVAHIHKWSNNEKWKQNGDDICLNNWLFYDKNTNKPRFIKNESFVSFGVGRRDCVGRLLAIKEISMILGHLILNYNLSLKDESIKIKWNMNITSIIDPPIGVNITRIKHIL